MNFNRRQLFRLLVVGGAFCCRGRSAQALGGTMPAIGSVAPMFDLEGTDRTNPDQKRWSLNDFQGRWLVLYFYPRDFTSGCTIEAHGFQSLVNEFDQAGASIVAISADNLEEHESFCTSEGLDFPLLSDPDGAVSRLYGSWMPPYSMRHTFLIDPEGVLSESWTGVRPVGHAREVLRTLQTACQENRRV